MSKESFSPETIAYTKEIIEEKVKIDFAIFLTAYQNNLFLQELKGKKKLTEIDLIEAILEDGRHQLAGKLDFDKEVAVGAETLAIALGFKIE